MLEVESVNGQGPDTQRNQILFDDLTPLHPGERFRLVHERASLATRMLDLLCPLGKGQQCLIASPPGAGKTVLLQEIARAIERNHPEAMPLVLLVAERPEEVTDMRQMVAGEVVSAIFDESPACHVQVAEIALAKAKRMAENRSDVVILLDSITRLARAYQHMLPPARRWPAASIWTGHGRAAEVRALLRGRAQAGGGRLVEHRRHRPGRYRHARGRRDLRGARGCEQRSDPPRLHADGAACLPVYRLHRSGTRREELLLPAGVLNTIRELRSRLQPLGLVASLEHLRSEMIQTESNEAFLATLRSAG